MKITTNPNSEMKAKFPLEKSQFKSSNINGGAVLASESLLNVFDDLEIATDPFENFDIIIEEVTESSLKDTKDEVQDAFKSPVTSLTLPAVATKLVNDIDTNQDDFSSETKQNIKTPVIDLSNIDFFDDLVVTAEELFNEDELALADTRKDKRNPEVILKNNVLVVCHNCKTL